MSTCNQLDLQTLGSQPIMPKNLPDHWFQSTKTYLSYTTIRNNFQIDVGASIQGVSYGDSEVKFLSTYKYSLDFGGPSVVYASTCRLQCFTVHRA